MSDKLKHGTSDTSRCPLCGREDKKLHFLRCSFINASIAGKKAFKQLKQEIVKLNVSPMMWHIIRAHLEDLPPPLSGDDPLDSKLIVVYEKQNILSQEQFLFGRLVGDFYDIATSTYDITKKKMTRSTYPKIWVSILRYVCEIWRIRSKFFHRSSEQSEKERALQEVETILHSADISYILTGDKSLLTRSPHNGWKFSFIHAWLKSVQTSITVGKRYATKNQTTLDSFLIK